MNFESELQQHDIFYKHLLRMFKLPAKEIQYLTEKKLLVAKRDLISSNAGDLPCFLGPIPLKT